jgi:polar amino acid transport system substrate-binding protein
MRKTAVCLMVVSLIALFTVVNAAAGPVLDRIMAKGQLVVGTSGEQPPMTATTKNGDLIGLDIDIARAMAQGLGVDIQFAKMPFAELLPALEAGKVDMVVSGMTITPARNRKVAFVGPYYVSGKGILALEKRYAELQDANGLNAPEVTVATLANSTSATFAETLMPKAKLTTTASYDEAIDLLLNSKADVMVADLPFCALTMLFICSAWAFISSEAEADSSAVAAFCCTTLSISVTALLICSTPWACSVEAAAISPTMSPTLARSPPLHRKGLVGLTSTSSEPS